MGLHAVRLRELDHCAPDVTGTQDPDLLPVQPDRARELVLFPFSAAQAGNAVRHAAIEAADERERELGDRRRILPRTVGDVDAALAGGRDVDVADTRAGTNDEI